MISRLKRRAVVFVLCTTAFVTSQFSEALAQKVALHATQEEIKIWNQRRVSGPFLDDWNRILSRANGFKASPAATWAGQTTATCWNGSAFPGRSYAEPVRDAAFMYMLTGDTSYFTPVRAHLLNQAAVAGTDFSNSQTWCPQSGTDSYVEITQWLRKLIYAYDYIKSGLAGSDKSTLDSWFLKAATYWNNRVDDRVKACFPGRGSDNYTNICGGDIDVTHWQGWTVQQGQPIWDNQLSMTNSFVGAAAVVLNNATLKAAAKKYIQEWVKYATYPDGTVVDQFRWKLFMSSPYDPPLGYVYAMTTIGSNIAVVDHLARDGDTSLYTYSTSEGVGTTAGGPKTILQILQRYAKMQQHLINVYGSDNATLTDCKRIDDFLDTSVCSGFPNNHRGIIDATPFAQANVFYNNPTIRVSYNRTPPSNPTSGDYDPFGGDWGNYPGGRFIFGLMEGEVFPYTGSNGTTPSLNAPSNLTIASP